MTIREELDELNEGFARDLAKQDVEGLIARYTDDAQFLLPGQPILRGREAVESTMRAWVEGGTDSLRFETRDIIADGSLVIDIGEIIGSTGPRSKYVVVYRRLNNGSLRIAVDAASSVSEQPTAE
jgi:ketosteroid isomerase-like protein